MAKLQATFTNLAGRYHKIHEMVNQQKEMFLQLNRYFIKISCFLLLDSHLFPFRNRYGPDIFEKNRPFPSAAGGKRIPAPIGNPLVYPLPSRIPANYVGPSPFEGRPDMLSMAKASLSSAAAAAGQQQQQQQQQQPGGGLMFQSPQPGAPPAYGVNSTLGPSFVSQPSSTSLMSQPGVLGTTLSPFGAGAATGAFQTGGKRGKH